ncbi:MAG: histidine phosphatase family protein [Rhizobacter sp.]|nr:histidine phosphatase family protein [Rhizobacter sp.]
MPQLTIVRHGQASFGADDYDKLSDLGVQQADRVGHWLAGCDFTPGRIVSGTLLRQRETADHCVAALGAERTTQAGRYTDAALDEYDNEEIMQVHLPALSSPHAVRAHIKAQPDPVRASRDLFLASMERWVRNERPADYRETWPAFNLRVRGAFMRAAEGLPDDAKVLVFSSGGVITSLVGDLLGIRSESLFELNWGLANGGITVVNARKGKLRLMSLNGIAHFEEMRDRRMITYR